jgi:hypothetical protein
MTLGEATTQPQPNDNYALPPPPTPTDIDSLKRWQVLTDQSLATTQAAAEKWRTGMAAFVTLVTGGLLIKGPSAANDISAGWRLVLTILAGGGLFAAISGLWLALRAAAGAPSVIDYTQIVARYGSIRRFEFACAMKTAQSLKWAKILVATSLVLLSAVVFTWWWVPSLSNQASSNVQAQVFGGTVCGTLLGEAHHALEIHVGGDPTPVWVPLLEIKGLHVVQSC